MAIFTFVLGLLLVAAGAGGLIASFDLLPTEIGLLYAVCGTLALSAGGVTLAIGALIRRLDVFATAMRSSQNRDSRQGLPAATEEAVAPPETEPPGGEEATEPAPADQPAAIEDEPNALADDDSVNENRSGHLPTIAAIEHALGEPEASPTLVGRYSAGGAHYMIFSDGSIEAETENGAFKFASMSDFKAYLAGARG
ncbi:MAG: hypothetical protein ABSA66_11335 [Roseiarcus sp.]|jgi:hypothetical protein